MTRFPATVILALAAMLAGDGRAAPADETDTSAAPAVAGTAIIVRVVVTGSADTAAAAPAGLQVDLITMQSPGGHANYAAATDSDGVARFDLPASPGMTTVAAVAAVEYQGATFRGQPFRLAPDQPRAETTVTLHPTATDASAAVVTSHAIFIGYPRDGFVSVQEVLFVDNPTGRMIVAPTAGEAVLRDQLPDLAQDVRILRSVGSATWSDSRRQVEDTGPISPGRSALAVSYRLPVAGLPMQFHKPLLNAANSLAVMLNTPSLALTGPVAAPVLVEPEPGQRFIQYEAKPAPAAGTTFTVSVAETPPLATLPTWAAIALGAIGLAVIVMLVIRRSDHRLAASRHAGPGGLP